MRGASVVAGLVAGMAGFGIAFAVMPADHAAGSSGQPGDRVRTAIASLEHDPLYIAPEDRWRFTDAQVSQLESTLRHQRVPTYLVYWDTQDGDWGVAIGDTALDQITTAIGRKGYYLSVDSADGFVTPAAIGYAPPMNGTLDSPAEPGPSLIRFLGDETDPQPPYPDSAGDGPGGSIAAGVSLGVSGAAVLCLLVWSAARVRRLFA